MADLLIVVEVEERLMLHIGQQHRTADGETRVVVAVAEGRRRPGAVAIWGIGRAARYLSSGH